MGRPLDGPGGSSAILSADHRRGRRMGGSELWLHPRRHQTSRRASIFLDARRYNASRPLHDRSVLTTQRREDELATRREQLTLQLAILSEQKAAKIISLIEELREDHPGIRDRSDHEATAMSTAADPHSVLEVIRDRHEALDVEEAAAQVKPDLTSTART